MALVDYTIEDNVAVLTMNSGENRFNFSFFDAVFEVLERIEKDTDATVLVTTSSHEKIWSTGIDLDWLRPAVEKEGQKLAKKFHSQMFAFFRRMLTFPMITVAAINGHAFAGGAFLSFSHDFRFMRKDKGWLCLPEVDLGMNLGPVLIAIARRALPEYKFEEMQFSGKRMTAMECEEHHIISKACPRDELMSEVLSFAKTMDKDREIIRLMKRETHEGLLGIIDDTITAMAG
jgi:Delta3-Delta2-enoyl-CoA isomerase